MLLQINRHTWVRPKSTRIALITDAQDDDRRRVWIVVPGTFDEPMEVNREFHSALLSELKVSIGTQEKFA
jgi:hypothetical protein